MMAHSKSLIVRKDTSLLNSILNDRTLFQLIVSNLLTLYTHLNTLTLHLFITHLPPLHQPHLLKPGKPDLDDVFSYLTVSCKLLIFNYIVPLEGELCSVHISLLIFVVNTLIGFHGQFHFLPVIIFNLGFCRLLPDHEHVL